MTKVAILGTGRMGAPMARRLLAEGFEVAVWNRTPQRAEPLASSGATVAGDPAQAVAGAGTVITMLSDATAVRQALLPVLPSLAAGVCVIQMSTIGPGETRELAARIPPGVAFVDATVGGSVGAAGSGKLRIFAGGDDAALALAEPVLGKLGTVRRCGAVGESSALKLVVNTGLITALAALHDALLVAEAVGVNRAVALEVLEAGPLAGAVKRASVTDSEFTTALAAKDARLALAEAKNATVLGAAERLLDAEPEPQQDITQLVRKAQK